MKISIKCSDCGTTKIVRDAWAEWSVETQEWVLSNIFDQTFCRQCEVDVSLTQEEVQS